MHGMALTLTTHNRDVTSVSLSGKSKRLFSNRVQVMQTFALCETLYESNIVTLDLSFNFLNDMAAQACARLIKFSKTLQSIDLSGNEFTSAGAKHIAEALISSPESTLSLEFLNLRSNSSIGDEGALSLSQCLRSNKSLKLLDLYDCGLGIKGIIAVCSAVAESESSALESLDIGRPLLSSPQDTTSLIIAQMLASDNCRLQKLGLSKHSMVDSNFETLVKYGLLKNSSRASQGLTSLDLSANKLGPFSGPTLELLLSNGGNQLEVLNFSANQLGDGGGQCIARCLPYAQSLRSLDLRNNNIGEVGLVSLAEALPLSSHLSSLFVWGNTFLPNASKAFSDSISAIGEGQLLVDIRPYSVDGNAQVACVEVQATA